MVLIFVLGKEVSFSFLYFPLGAILVPYFNEFLLTYQKKKSLDVKSFASLNHRRYDWIENYLTYGSRYLDTTLVFIYFLFQLNVET